MVFTISECIADSSPHVLGPVRTLSANHCSDRPQPKGLACCLTRSSVSARPTNKASRARSSPLNKLKQLRPAKHWKSAERNAKPYGDYNLQTLCNTMGPLPFGAISASLFRAWHLKFAENGLGTSAAPIQSHFLSPTYQQNEGRE